MNIERRATLKEANYSLIKKLNSKEYLLLNNDTKKYEVWCANKNHASYGLKYRNTHLEFVRSL